MTNGEHLAELNLVCAGCERDGGVWLRLHLLAGATSPRRLYSKTSGCTSASVEHQHRLSNPAIFLAGYQLFKRTELERV